MYAFLNNQIKKSVAIICLLLFATCELSAQKHWDVYSIAPSTFSKVVDTLAAQADNHDEFLVAYLAINTEIPQYNISICSYPKENECNGFLQNTRGVVLCEGDGIMYIIGDIDYDVFRKTGGTLDLQLPDKLDYADLIDDGIYSVNKRYMFNKHAIFEMPDLISEFGILIEEYHKNDYPFAVCDIDGRRILETSSGGGYDETCTYYPISGMPVKVRLLETRVIIANKMISAFGWLLKRSVYYDLYSRTGKRIGRRYVWQNSYNKDSFESDIHEISHIVPVIRYRFVLF